MKNFSGTFNFGAAVWSPEFRERLRKKIGLKRAIEWKFSVDLFRGFTD